MKAFAERFYKSKAWQKCRDGYIRSKGGLCEKCLSEGRISAGIIVHHKVPITEKNILNNEITLNWDNLQLLCRFHHEEVHGKYKKRYRIDEYGRVVII